MSDSASLYEVHVDDLDSGQKSINFADVGSGIGQAAPVLVEGLRTDKGSLFLVQEPEIHLHPDAQLAMADFLLHLAGSGRRVIAETHSETLLLRIRRRIAERKRGGLGPDEIGLIIVDRAKGHSEARPVTLDDLGQAHGWPPKFMEQASEERLALLHAAAGKLDS
jgi:predicted ATPase